ncbi:MAG TPA: protein translocase subunit SecD [Humisphaera sp.]
MSHQYFGRLAVIVTVLVLALLAIFWPSVKNPGEVGFNPDVPWSQKTNLRPGIDIVGGVSLLYEIKAPDGRPEADLASKVTTALKKRVDPNGTENLIWRPENPNRLEIQLPYSGSSAKASARAAAIAKAKADVEATRVRIPDVQAWLAKGKDRDKAQAAALSKGYPKRQAILEKLADAYDRRAAAEAESKVVNADPAKVNERPAVQARLKQADADYHKLIDEELPATNLESDVKALDAAFAKRERDAQEKAVAAKKKEIADAPAADKFPARDEAAVRYLDARLAATAGGDTIGSGADLKRLLSGAGVLEFHIVADRGSVPPPRGAPAELRGAGGGYQAWVQRLRTIGAAYQDDEDYRWFEVDDPTHYGSGAEPDAEGKLWVLASMRPEQSLDRRNGDWKVTRVGGRPDDLGRMEVDIEFDSNGAIEFGRLTGANQQKLMAIMLDNRVISAATIQGAIPNGQVRITRPDGYPPAELAYMTKMLGGGALPAQLSQDPIYERAVGPQLGEDNLRRGLIACGSGLVIVGIFLVTYYYLAGAVAFVGVLLNLVIILGAMAAFGGTFTLPGIAAIVLTVGSAVDSNVLIFERLREEQQRGLPLRQALANAYDRAFSAILDSNMTTLITSVFLYYFGTEEVKGFGITLIIGILASLFTSLYVTKTVFGLLVDRWGVTQLGSLPLTYPRWNKALHPKVRWVRLALPLAAASVAFIVAGCIAFGVYAARGTVMDVEFASGTSVTFELDKPAKQEQVRDWINGQSAKDPRLPAPSVVRVGADDRTWEVTTPNPDRTAVQESIRAVVKDKLKAEPTATFPQIKDELKTVADRQGAVVPKPDGSAPVTILPLTAETLGEAYAKAWPAGTIPEEARKYANGAAIFIRGLEPKLPPKAVTERVTRQRLQAATVGGQALPTDVVTIAADGGPDDRPAADVIVLAADPSLDYARLVKLATNAAGTDPARAATAAAEAGTKWQYNLKPLWDVARQAVGQAPEFQQVRSVNASVAGETQQKALTALVLSLLVIMAYVWFRFGNLKYGTATVMALLHDVLFCFAALGFAHLLSDTWLGELLLLQPFRINLTLIAAVLTVMGYSMLDTIVVFDRIREIRGKFGHVSGGVIDDAVNQTLSRTILTAGTTVVSVAIMYFVGGEGIHGFTFVLLIGILAGTYSSIAIAAPILLIGRDKGREETPSRDEGKSLAKPATT